ncbi:MAG: glycoside hydrolase family 3 protein [Rhodoferax sp.]|nr:glycoside hydrolase family 3 protein [Actinomycetota bacterium]
MTRPIFRVVVTAGLVALAACSTSAPPAPRASPPSTTAHLTTAPTATTAPAPTASAPTPTTPATTPAPTPAASDPVAATLRAMTLEQRVGQLLMVGGAATGVGRATRRAVTRHHVGNVMLTGRSSAGVAATARVSAGVRALATRSATGGVPPFIATDQEGGAVQVLRGNGFSKIPSGVVQGGWSPATLRRRAAQWGSELRAAGVDLDLAPVADTVTPGAADDNPPIGRFGRQLGSTPDDVGDHVLAFNAGLRAAGVAATVKHFPGLGRVRANTDVSSGVTDRTTTRRDPALAPFARAVDAGVPFVMMSTATYTQIDPRQPAAFSAVVIGRVLRDDLGFDGVVISDDLGSARQVASVPPGQRAVRFVAAGGDVVLTVDPDVLPAMQRALLARARSDPEFRAAVDAAATRVLTAKLRQGLLKPRS